MTRNTDYMKNQAWWAARVKHGGYAGGKESPEHYVWRSMLARCNRKTDRSYERYGARGITVCKRWERYENFLADMGARPSPEHSLERKNNERGYTPSNCVWATRSEQQQNKNSTRLYSYKDTVDTLVGWARRLGISKELAHWRFKTWGAFEKEGTWQELQKTQ